MKRRTLTLSGIVVSLGIIASVVLYEPTPSFASNSIDYTPGLIKKELASGSTVFVIYASDWCLTCIRQERVIKKLRTSNLQYDEKMTFIRVDWSEYSDAEVTTSRNIPRRSTLLVLRGDEEIGRIVAATDTDKIKALLDKGL